MPYFFMIKKYFQSIATLSLMEKRLWNPIDSSSLMFLFLQSLRYFCFKKKYPFYFRLHHIKYT